MEECISIIVPIYNVEKYLKRCLDSIISQTYSNLEILLVDDGSKDSSLSICREYEKKDLRIRVYHKDNEGLGLTRNYGIAKATGKYVTFVDSDDYIVVNAIEVLIQKAQETEADIVIANYYYKDTPQKIFLKEQLYTGDSIKDIIMVHMMGNAANVPDGLSCMACGKLYKKELFTKHDFKFPSERKLIWEDLAFSINVYPVCQRIYVSHFPIYYYCFNENSLTHMYKPDKLELVMVLYQYMIKKIKKTGLPSEALHRLDNNFIGHIRTCIKLEVFYARQNGFKKALNNIGDICNRKDVQELIRGYPKQDFNKAQRIYNFFMENKFIIGVYLLTWLQNKKKRIE